MKPKAGFILSILEKLDQKDDLERNLLFFEQNT